MDTEPTDPGPGAPSPSDVLRWGMALTGEVMRLPATAAKAREVVVVLPDQLAELIADGAPAEIGTEQLIAEHYGATVWVIEQNGAIAVVPVRTR